MTYINTITSKGQMTIPKEFRRKLGLDEIGRAYIRMNSRNEIIITRPKTPAESLAEIQQILAHPAGKQQLSEKARAIGDYLAKKYDVH
jgi:AbrB family looped-hinge helix DNA binding protein